MNDAALFRAVDRVDAQMVDFVDREQYFRLQALGPEPARNRLEQADLRWSESSTDEYGRPLRRGSVAVIGTHFLVLVDGCRTVLEPVLGSQGEFLSAELEGRPVWMFRTTNYVDAIVREQSVLTNKARLRHGDHLVVDVTRTLGAQIFCLSEEPRLGTWFTAGARDRLLSTGLFDTIDFRSPKSVTLVRSDV